MKCIHNLGHLPPWKSLMKLTQISRLYPKKLQKEFETEVLGVPEDTGEGYIPGALIDALVKKKRLCCKDIEFDVVYVGLDPLSHGRSEMGICALAYSDRGEKVVLGIASVPTKRTQLIEVKTAIKVFMERLREHPGTGLATVIPIVEWYGTPGPRLLPAPH